jgi:putative hydrolase of the HAD superfamily
MKVPAKLRLITFDLDDTLWPCMPVINRAEKILHDWLARHAPQLAAGHSVEMLREHRHSVSKAHPDIAHNLTLTRQMSLQRLLDEYGHDTDLAYQAIEVFRHERNQVTPYKDVEPVLAQLMNAYYLVSVTNGNAEVEATPLQGYFKHTLTAESVGASKPDPAMFIEAMRLADVSPQQTLHVGDDPVTDIQAAQNVGITCVWLNRHQQSWPDDMQPPQHEISSLHELPVLLER